MLRFVGLISVDLVVPWASGQYITNRRLETASV